MQTDVVMTGIGGQGIQLAAKTLATGAIEEGRQAMLSAHWGGEMRGGQTEASVAISDGRLRALPILPVISSAFVMHPKFWSPVLARLKPGAPVVTNGDLVEELDVLDGRLFTIPATTIASSIGAPMGAGFVLLGAYCAITGLVGGEALVAAMKALVPPYRTQHIVANETCLRAGADAGPELAAPVWQSDANEVTA
jgi:2-oxoglutarate ferredoxin oxidoreductase subunit gamma